MHYNATHITHVKVVHICVYIWYTEIDITFMIIMIQLTAITTILRVGVKLVNNFTISNQIS